MVTAHRLHLASDLNFSLMLGNARILAPHQGAAGDGQGGMELSQMAALGCQIPLDLVREGGEEGQDLFPWATRGSGCRRGENAVSRRRKELPGQISQTPVRLQQIPVTGFLKDKRLLGEGRHRCFAFAPNSTQPLQRPKESAIVFWENHTVCILQQPCALGEIPPPRLWVSGVGADPGATGG